MPDLMPNPTAMFTRYGMMFPCDCDVLDACLADLLTRKAHLRVLEIGGYNGDTARGMKKFVEEHGGTLEYWGIDPGLVLHHVDLPFEGAHMIEGKSEWSFHLVPDNLDLVFCDGDHSRNAVILDTFNYSGKVLPGGFFLFHDTNPLSQGTGYEYEGPPHIPQFGIAVMEAWDLMKWPWAPWEFFMERIPEGHHQNGMTAFFKRP